MAITFQKLGKLKSLSLCVRHSADKNTPMAKILPGEYATKVVDPVAQFTSSVLGLYRSGPSSAG